MITFFAIILVLLAVNASLLLFSTSRSKDKTGELTDRLADQKPSDIYPLDSGSSDYKKAI